MKLAQRAIVEGDKSPRGYGFAWYDYEMMQTIAYPIPFNWIARWFRDFWWFLCRGKRNDALEKAYHDGRKQMHKTVIELRDEIQVKNRTINKLYDTLNTRQKDVLKEAVAKK